MTKIGFVGAGTVGSALAIRLAEQGYPIVAVSSRNQSSAGKLAGRIVHCRVAEKNQEAAELADLVFITPPNDAIASVVNAMHWRSGQMVLHGNGASSTD